MPSPITRKSTRLRVAHRTMVDTVQPRVLASFRNPLALSPLMNMQRLRGSKANHRARHKTRASLRSDQGLDAANHKRASGGGRRMFLTVITTLRLLFAR